MNRAGKDVQSKHIAEHVIHSLEGETDRYLRCVTKKCENKGPIIEAAGKQVDSSCPLLQTDSTVPKS
jgi:hypothetical protein